MHFFRQDKCKIRMQNVNEEKYSGMKSSPLRPLTILDLEKRRLDQPLSQIVCLCIYTYISI